MVAVVLGFAVTVIPAYVLGLITKSDILNVFVGTGLGRYARLGLLAATWALAITAFVTVAAPRRRHR